LDNTILWALLTGGITGGVWVAIVVFDRVRRLMESRDELEDRLEQLEDVNARLEDVAERLAFTERVLLTEKAEEGDIKP
jgi:hypothetical protein